MKTNQKVLQMVTIVALFIAIVFISVGFAMMSTQLTITGTAKVVPADWSVHFDDTSLQFTNNSTAAYSETTEHTPTLSVSSFTDYQIVLTKPGDKGTFTFDVVNDGDIDAKISSATFDQNAVTYSGTNATVADKQIVADNVTYRVVWDSDGSAIAQNDTLNHGVTKKIRVEAEYNSNADELPEHEVILAGRDLTITFVQAN